MCAAQIPSSSATPPIIISRIGEEKTTLPNIHPEVNSNESTSSSIDSSHLERMEGLKLQSDLIQTAISHRFRAQIFTNAIIAAKEGSTHGAYVHAYQQKDYENMNLCIIDDGLAGCAVKEDGDIVSVFKNNACTIRGVLDYTIPEAIKMGGNHLDCFAPDLPVMYARYGFIPIAKVKFVDEYAPENWNYDRDGRPDIIFMVLDREAMKIDSKTGFSTIGKAEIEDVISQYIATLKHEETYNNAVEKTKEKIASQ